MAGNCIRDLMSRVQCINHYTTEPPHMPPRKVVYENNCLRKFTSLTQKTKHSLLCFTTFDVQTRIYEIFNFINIFLPQTTTRTTLWLKNRTAVISTNSCTEYDPISVIVGLDNCQIVFSLQVCNCRVLMKLFTSFAFYTAIFNLLQQTTRKLVYAKTTIF